MHWYIIYWKNALFNPPPPILGGILANSFFGGGGYEKKRKGIKRICEKREGKMKDKILPKRLE
jgi:hypothetical protein